jgi:hypothetical protein
VKGIPANWSAEETQAVFSQFGNILGVDTAVYDDTGTSKLSARICFGTLEGATLGARGAQMAASTAVNNISGIVLGQSVVTVDLDPDGKCCSHSSQRSLNQNINLISRLGRAFRKLKTEMDDRRVAMARAAPSLANTPMYRRHASESSEHRFEGEGSSYPRRRVGDFATDVRNTFVKSFLQEHGYTLSKAA